MTQYDRFILRNGLRVIFHQDVTTPLVAVNILYNVGARDEDPQHTGFAHLFEHLMFGGSVNIPDYDGPLEMVGGENNAFTSNDITNYYLTLPKENIETGFWLESDRMLNLAFSKKSLEVQKEVVANEFMQSYLNQPYGDVWLLLRPLAYKLHPYQWATIGKELEHITNSTLADVKQFFKKFYTPSNAILVVAGNTTLEEVRMLAEKWFEGIPEGTLYQRNLIQEPLQTAPRYLTVERDVPYSRIYKAYHMCDRLSHDFYVSDLISDILSEGNSSRFIVELMKKKQLFSDINAYHLDTIDAGLFVVSGTLLDGVSMEVAEEAIQQQLQQLCDEKVDALELQKVKNKNESNIMFSEINILSKALSLAFGELLGDANMINTEIEKYNKVTVEDIQRVSKQLFTLDNSSTLYYLSKK